MGTSAHAERRSAPRRPYQGTVELAHPDEQESYEADVVDLSLGGMAVRTGYLPDVGSELDCRFALEDGQAVSARGEVVWTRNAEEDGRFGLRFTSIDGKAKQALKGSSPVRAEEDDRARIHLPGMEAPLRARTRERSDEHFVLASELSFLRLDEQVEIERANERVRGVMRGVSVEFDPKTKIVRLLLDIETGTPKAPAKTQKKEAPVPVAVAPAPAPVTKAEAPVAERPAQRTELLSPEPSATAPSTSAPAKQVIPAPEAFESESEYELGPDTSHEDSDVLADDPSASLEERKDGQPPAWLVGALTKARTIAVLLREKGGESAKKALTLLSGAVLLLVARARGQKLEASTTADAPSNSAPRSHLRKQVLNAEPEAAPSAIETNPGQVKRRRLMLIGMGGFGLAAIVFALASSGSDPAPRAPRPQVAVATAAAPASTTTSTTEADPPAAETAPTPAETPTAAPAPAAGTAAPMPSDLVAASRSVNADVEASPITIRQRSAAPRAPAVRAPAPAVAARATPAPAPNATPSSRVLGSPAVRTGTMLRLRMDGVVTNLSGGVAPGNAIVLRMPGRRSLDLAAPLVRQDSRILNAAVYNRATGAEFTLRFREAVPTWSARVVGGSLELVLAAPARAAARVAPRR